MGRACAMEIVAALVATVLLTVAAIAISRAGGAHHQEDLNDHATRQGGGRSVGDGRPHAARTDDRPAGPDAEATGVSGPGAPSVDPASEQAGR